MIKLSDLVSCEYKILKSILLWFLDIDSKFLLHDCSDLIMLYISWFHANHVKRKLEIGNLLGLFVDSLLLLFSENLIEEDEQMVHTDSE